ncbi:MAG: PDZ domain-containing protein [Akkermansiaceae bacterium]|jgi:hypothetical protein|nr:PDZ domain-containing protein [Akkermansiaceae bacterium]MCU0778237.1 PDZ domain-containing protein [Akkermansiaceae bacterium]
MKTITIIAGIGSLVVASLWAIEGEPDDARPPLRAEAPAAPEALPPAAAAEKAAAPYIGVVSNAVTAALAEHLGLKPGEGIVVGAVMPGGPAEKAGVAMHDVITRLGGEPVGSPEELTHRVASHKPGDSVKLDLIHKGKSTELEVVLGTRPEQLVMRQPGALDQLNLQGVPQDLADRVRRMIEGNLGELKLDFDQGFENAAPQMEDALREMRKRMDDAMQGVRIPEPPQGGIRIHRDATFRLMDDQGSIELKSNDGGKEITARDKDNHITWNGPWDTEQDKAAAPEDIRQRVERLNIDDADNGIRLNFRAVPQR